MSPVSSTGSLCWAVSGSTRGSPDAKWGLGFRGLGFRVSGLGFRPGLDEGPAGKKG